VEIDVNIQGLGLELGETVGNHSQSSANGFEVVQGFFQAKVFQVVAENLQTQGGRELLIHAKHDIFGTGAQHMMAMFHSFQDGGELASHSLVEAKAKHLG
jgi:hypothetical protein